MREIPIIKCTYLDEVEQLDNTDRLSQKAESVSGLSVRFPLTVDCFLAISELVGLDLDSLFEDTEVTGEGCFATIKGKNFIFRGHFGS